MSVPNQWCVRTRGYGYLRGFRLDNSEETSDCRTRSHTWPARLRHSTG